MVHAVKEKQKQIWDEHIYRQWISLSMLGYVIVIRKEILRSPSQQKQK